MMMSSPYSHKICWGEEEPAAKGFWKSFFYIYKCRSRKKKCFNQSKNLTDTSLSPLHPNGAIREEALCVHVCFVWGLESNEKRGRVTRYKKEEKKEKEIKKTNLTAEPLVSDLEPLKFKGK